MELINVEGAYKKFELPRGNMQTFIDGVKTLDIRGFNVTIPYKEEVMSFLDYISDEAKNFGAVNTVVNKDGNTPLINALLTGKKEVFEYFKEIYPKENITKLFYDLAFQQEAKNSYMIQNMVEKAVYTLIGDQVDWKEFNSKENKDSEGYWG